MTNKTKVTDEAKKLRKPMLDAAQLACDGKFEDSTDHALAHDFYVQGWQAASQHYGREPSLNNKSASELLEMSALPFDKACLMVRDMERELAEIKDRYEANTAIMHARTQRMNELSAQVNQLLNDMVGIRLQNDKYIKDGHIDHIVCNALAATAQQSLQPHTDAVIEFCANSLEGAPLFADKIRSLKGTYHE